ncbi:MAG: MATE family efflux transporter [Planctomycetaceae bacterium]|jgi:putative MATE family efflux protein
MSTAEVFRPRHQVLALALPALGEQLLNFTVALYDTFLAGYISTGGHETGLYTTTVGIASYLGWLASLLFALVGTGTTALVSRARGRGDLAEANRFANRSLLLVTPLALLIAGALYAAAPRLAARAGLVGESGQVLTTYLRTDALGQLLFGYCLVGAAALRGMGDMRTPMWILGGVNLLNMLVATALVFGTRGNSPFQPLAGLVGDWNSWGVSGIVSGTLSARLAGGAAMLCVLARGINGLRLTPSLLIPDLADLRRILRVGLPAALEGLTLWTGQWLFLEIISQLGSESDGSAYKAAHMIGMDAEALTYLPATAWGYAAASLVGQNLGANRPEQARAVTQEATRHAIVIALIGAMVYYFGAETIYQVMSREEPVRVIGAPALRFLSWYQIPLAMVIVYLQAIRGAGDTRAVLMINFLGFFLVRLPIAWWLGLHLQLGLIGAWSGMSIDVLCRAIVAGIYFARGGWSRTQV